MTTTDRTELLLGHTAATTIRFVQENFSDGNPTSGPIIVLAIEPREWDVTDPAARETVARVSLGDDYDLHCTHCSAQWWIDKDRNAAGLAVYRPVTEDTP